MANRRPIPNLQDLDRYNVNRAGMVEGIRQSLYDFTTYAALGQTQLSFFQTPRGQGGKTLADTNLEVAGSLPSPKRFLVENIQLFFFPGNDVAVSGAPAQAANVQDTYDVHKSGYLDFFIGSKSYLTEAPIGRFPPESGLSLFAALADSTTAGANQLRMVDYARFGGRCYDVDPPILLVPTQNFQVTLNWPAAIPIVSAARIGIVLGGILYRNSQ